MRGRSNNHKIVTICEMFIFKWRFLCRCRLCSLSSLILNLPGEPASVLAYLADRETVESRFYKCCAQVKWIIEWSNKSLSRRVVPWFASRKEICLHFGYACVVEFIWVSFQCKLLRLSVEQGGTKVRWKVLTFKFSCCHGQLALFPVATCRVWRQW